MRVLGGTLKKMEHTYDFTTGKNTTLWFIFITLKDTKERGCSDDSPDIATVSDVAAVDGSC